MSVRTWIYTVLGIAFLTVALLTAYDQLLVEYGNDSAYILGKATPAAVWVLTLGTPVVLFDFFRWLHRSDPASGSTLLLATAATGGSFLVGWLFARRRSLTWLVESDLEVHFGRDEFIEIVVGLWSACAAALVLWLALRTKPSVDQRTAANVSQ